MLRAHGGCLVVVPSVEEKKKEGKNKDQAWFLNLQNIRQDEIFWANQNQQP